MKRVFGTAIGTLALALFAGVTSAAPMQQPVAVAGAYRVLLPVKLYLGTAPGSENPAWPERITGDVPDRIIYNVSSPNYTPYLPNPDRATGTAVIIAPGGGFHYLAVDNEGNEVAKWLAERGIAAFVLKYRVVQTDPSNPPLPGPPPPGKPRPVYNMEQDSRQAIADGILSIKLIRQRATAYGIDPNNVVFMGFSAGAMLTIGTVFQDDIVGRPNYAAPIYGGPFGQMPAIPADLPPLFIAYAQNDSLASPHVRGLVDALIGAGYQPEVHVFNGGSHGFGMHMLGTTSDHWKDSFFWWLQSEGLTQKPGDPPRPETPAFARPIVGQVLPQVQ